MQLHWQDINTDLTSVRDSCLKIQQAIEASEGADADSGSPDVRATTLHQGTQCMILCRAQSM